MNTSLFHTLGNIPHLDATLDESDSYYFLQQYYIENYLQYKYSAPDIYSFDVFDLMCNNFCMFYGKVTDFSGNSFSSPISINRFRFILHEDGSYSNYYTIKRKYGYVVEGMYWSNGMCYQLREDKSEDFEVYQKVLFIDNLTKNLYQFP